MQALTFSFDAYSKKEPMNCTVKILKMTSLTDADWGWNNQDPFVTVQYGGKKHVTARRDGAGKVAKWANE